MPRAVNIDGGIKTCPACTRKLVLSEFYSDARTATGLCTYCRECSKKKARTRYYKHHERVLAYEKVRAVTPERKAKRREYQHKMAGQNAIKLAARQAVKAELRAGRMVPQPCVGCGNPRSWGHHPDYNKPLDVVWMCPRCHGREHRVFAEGFR